MWTGTCQSLAAVCGMCEGNLSLNELDVRSPKSSTVDDMCLLGRLFFRS
jgi:hypothetical protein